MPVNLLTEACICQVREAIVFWSPTTARMKAGTSKAQEHLQGLIYDVQRPENGSLIFNEMPI